MSDPGIPAPAAPALSSAVQDAQGSFSSRRVGAFVALGCLVLGFVAILGCIVGTIVAGKPLPDNLVGLLTSLINVMATCVVGGLLFATADRWAPK